MKLENDNGKMKITLKNGSTITLTGSEELKSSECKPNCCMDKELSEEPDIEKAAQWSEK